MYAGPIAEGEEALRAIREFGPPDADFFGAMPYTEMQSSIDDPPGMRNYWTAEYVADLPDETLDRIATRGEDKPIPFGQVFCVAWGGAVPRVPEGDTPLTGRDAKFIIHPLVLWETPPTTRRRSRGAAASATTSPTSPPATPTPTSTARLATPGEGGVRAEPRAAGADQGRVGSRTCSGRRDTCRLLPRIEQALGVEGPLDPREASGWPPWTGARARSASPTRSRARRTPSPRAAARARTAPRRPTGRARAPRVVGRDEERRVQVAVTRVPPAARLELVAATDRDRLLDRLAEAVDQGRRCPRSPSPRCRDRDRDAVAPPPQLVDIVW